MPNLIHHGIRTTFETGGAIPLVSPSTSIIGVIGTSNNADAEAFPLNTPVLVNSPVQVEDLDYIDGTLRRAIESVYSQTSVICIAVRVMQEANENDTIGNICGNEADRTGIYSFLMSYARTGYIPRVFVAPGWTHQITMGSIGSITIDNGGAFDLSNNGFVLAIFDAPPNGGITAVALGLIEAGVLTTLYTPSNSPSSSPAVPPPGPIPPGPGFTLNTDIFPLSDGLGYTTPPSIDRFIPISRATNNPTITAITPTTSPSITVTLSSAAASSVATTFESITRDDRLRGVTILDAAPPTLQSNHNTAMRYVGLLNSDRQFVVYPSVRISFEGTTINDYLSGYVASLIVKTDRDNGGVHFSPSNRIIRGIVGLTTPIQYSLSDPTADSNLLNRARITLAIFDNGFYLWGNRTTSSNTFWTFITSRRIADLIALTLEITCRPLIDRPITTALIRQILSKVNRYLNTLVTAGAISGGNGWVDPSRNTSSTLAAGRLSISYRFSPVFPLESLEYDSTNTTDFIEDVLQL